MVTRVLPGTAVRLRRGRRRDLPRLEGVLGAGAVARLARVWRRLLADLGCDVYVAEEPGGAIVGVVAITYSRSLLRGGPAALLDGARALEAGSGLLDGLVAFAEQRARKRGCRWLGAAVGADEPELRAALVARGWHAGELLSTDLAGAA
jgi:hypothetical protein